MTENTPKPCPFCGAEMIEAEAFRTRNTRTYTHPVTDGSCPAMSVQIRVLQEIVHASDVEENLRLERWNAAPRQADALIWPEEITPALVDALGQMLWITAPLAYAMRGEGMDIPRKTEPEQAHALFFLATMALKYGDGWKAKTAEEMRAMIARYKARGVGKGGGE